MSLPIYERYKECLRRGHVAALRGQLEHALEAYTDASLIAPDRALPHASRGTVLLRLGRSAEALEAFSSALQRAPRDEAALLGYADALLALGRRVDAADALDRVAELQVQDGHVPEAGDTARRALDLAESRARRALVERLSETQRSIPADDEAATALSRVAGPPEPPAADEAVETPAATQAPGGLDAEPTIASEMPPDEPDTSGADTGAALTAEAERLVLAREPGATERCLAAAKAHRAAGRVDAAIDACYLGLAVAPGDTSVHLALAELYLERGWQAPAVEKLLLLGRLVDLDGDAELRARVCAIVDARFADDPRLAALCS
jgi:tetratricopeptide (TPR) repeat protein